MSRSYAAGRRDGVLSLGVALLVLAALAFKPDLLWALPMLYARFWDGVVTPLLTRIITGG